MPRPPKEQEEWQITPLARLKHVLPTPRKKFLSPALEITAAIAGLLFAVTFFGPAEYNLQGAGVRAALAPAPAGRTVVEIPPLGTITLKTHSTPLEIRLTLKDIRPELFRQDFDLSSADGLIDSFLPAAKKAAFLFAAREIFLGGCGAALALFLLCRADRKRCLAGAAAAAFFLTAFFAATGLTFTTKGLREPKFAGIISFAPQMLALTEKDGKGFSGFKEKAAQLAGDFQQLLARIDRLPLGRTALPGTLKLLAVSDLHNNPLGIDFTAALADQFKVDAVLDAGDLTDYGSALELKIAGALKKLPVPYVFAAGNHDRTAVVDFVQSLPQGRALKGKTVAIKGLKILGSPDPLVFRRSAPEVEPNEDSLASQTAGLKKALQEEGRPDLLLVHNPDVARAFAGAVPVLVAGHTHRPAAEKIRGSIYVNPGSTGAAGTRGLAASARTEYSAAILYFSPQSDKEGGSFVLEAVDLVKFDPRSGRLGVERQLF